MITAPMLAGKCSDVTKLSYPLLASPKLDGVRALTINGKAVSRKFKPIPNHHIRRQIENMGIDGLDGEIMIDGKSFNDLSGDVRRESGIPNFFYAVFDWVRGDLHREYCNRMADLKSVALPSLCRKILPVEIADVAALSRYEESQLKLGFEGIMVRSPSSPYKCGRSTENEGYLLKIKRFEDDEAVIVGYEEEMQNNNIATRDAFGRTERSSHKENLVGKGVLGKLICTNKSWPKEFGIGTGFDAALRSELWVKRGKLKHKIVKFKHQPPPIGAPPDDRPRFPVFLGFRDEWDM